MNVYDVFKKYMPGEIIRIIAIDEEDAKNIAQMGGALEVRFVAFLEDYLKEEGKYQ